MKVLEPFITDFSILDCQAVLSCDVNPEEQTPQKKYPAQSPGDRINHSEMMRSDILLLKQPQNNNTVKNTDFRPIP